VFSAKTVICDTRDKLMLRLWFLSEKDVRNSEHYRQGRTC